MVIDYAMVCPYVRGNNPRAFASGLSPVQAGELWYIYNQCRPWSLRNTVDPLYLDFGYLELLPISKRKSDPCFNIENLLSGNRIL